MNISVLILQFRVRIQDIFPDLPAQHDHYLLRWLRGEISGLKHTHTQRHKHLFCVFSTTVLQQRLKYREQPAGPNVNKGRRSTVRSLVSRLLWGNLPQNWVILRLLLTSDLMRTVALSLTSAETNFPPTLNKHAVCTLAVILENVSNAWSDSEPEAAEANPSLLTSNCRRFQSGWGWGGGGRFDTCQRETCQLDVLIDLLIASGLSVTSQPPSCQLLSLTA